MRIIHQTSRLSGVLSVTETGDGVAFGLRSLGPDCRCGPALSLAMCLARGKSWAFSIEILLSLTWQYCQII